MQNTPASNLGLAVERRRKELGLSQEELGSVAGCGRVFISQLENGKPSVRLDKVLDVIYALGLEFRVQNGQGRLVVQLHA